jgi:hypothetical protein
METDGYIARLSQEDETTLRSTIEASAINALRVNERREVSLAALRGLLYTYYPMGLETPYLESPMTELFTEVEEAINGKKS